MRARSASFVVAGAAAVLLSVAACSGGWHGRTDRDGDLDADLDRDGDAVGAGHADAELWRRVGR